MMLKKFIILIIAALILLGILFAYKMGRTVMIVGGEAERGLHPIWSTETAFLPHVPEKEESRIDILIVGIRGANGKDDNAHGDFLADTIMLASFNKKNNKTSIVSIPRDLYVQIPEYGNEKINSSYAIGEARYYGGGGLEMMRVLVSIISGVYVDHVISIDFDGFRKIVDDIGGIMIYRDTLFEESKQWIHDGREGKRYWRLDDTGWTFYVPEGANPMNSDEALYYTRSRYSSSDFDRMHRQQEALSAIKSKALNLGVLANPVRIFNILNTLEDNVRTDMSISQIKELINIGRKAKIQDFKKDVLGIGEDGILIEDTVDGRFVLLPKSGDYSQIGELFKKVVE